MKTYFKALFSVIILLTITSFLPGCIDGGKLQSITITPEEGIIVPGVNQQFHATAHFSDGTTVDWTTACAWTITLVSGPTSTTTIGNTPGAFGLVISPTEGTYEVQATETALNISGKAHLYVVAPSQASTQIVPAVPFMDPEKTYKFIVVTELPVNLVSGGTKTVTYDLTSLATWSVPDNLVATQDTSTPSLVTAATTTTTKTTDLKATYGTFTVPAILTVKPFALESVSIDQLEPIIISQNTATQFTATGNYPLQTDVRTEVFTSSVVWSSSAPDVASINSANGLVTTQTKTGTTSITALDPISQLSTSKTLTVQ